jgi:hypothetical protein
MTECNTNNLRMNCRYIKRSDATESMCFPGVRPDCPYRGRTDKDRLIEIDSRGHVSNDPLPGPPVDEIGVIYHECEGLNHEEFAIKFQALFKIAWSKYLFTREIDRIVNQAN